MVLKEIESRKCIRQFSNKKIPLAQIKEILEAGRLAPSWMNVQPWQFIVTDNDEQKKLLSLCANFQKQIAEASHVIIVLGDLTAWNDENFSIILSQRGVSKEGISHILNDKGYNPAKNSEEIKQARTMEQCAYAMGFMTLQAENLGINSCIIGAFANEITGFRPELLSKIREEFSIPQEMFITGLITLGFKAENVESAPRMRKAFNDIVSIEQYGNKIG